MGPLCTGVILSGGLNTRFSGKDKSFIRLGNQTIIDSIYSIFNTIFDEIIIVTNAPLDYIRWNVTIVSDIFPTRSSLTGLYSGLFYSSHPYSFFIACDTPFLKKELVTALVNQIRPDVDAVVPETSKGLEPLFAVYSQKCLKIIEHQYHQDNFKIRSVLDKVRTAYFTERKIKEIDPDMHSFFNINTPDDLTVAKTIAKKYTGN